MEISNLDEKMLRKRGTTLKSLQKVGGTQRTFSTVILWMKLREMAWRSLIKQQETASLLEKSMIIQGGGS